MRMVGEVLLACKREGGGLATPRAWDKFYFLSSFQISNQEPSRSVSASCTVHPRQV